MVKLIDLIKQEGVPERKNLSDKGGLSFKTILASEASCEVHSPEDLKRPSEKKQKQGFLLYEKMCSFIRDITEKIAKNEGFALERGFELIAEALNPPENIELLYYWALHPREVTDFLIRKPVNVSVFSLKMSRGLGYSRDQQLELCIAAMLLDIGMGMISQELPHKEGSFTPQELEDIQKHPIHGYEKILILGENYQWLADIVLQTHEREDGSGYPLGLKGKDIHEYAKIIGVADTFEALTHYRPYRRQLSQAVKEIIGSQKHLFSYHILKVFIQEMTVFPISSYVKLNSGVIGKVITTSKDHPFRPTIEIIFDAEGKKVNGHKLIKLREAPLLHIIAPADELEANQYTTGEQWQEAEGIRALGV
ncbi:MAG: hypothetical protein A3G93_07445 [Nitrospinae bacterium RIFCSPLOWO2_12_FULL_45_22]|nr:MAG: hypothetical protein A3G93_07445 [Nitrospinae bacterium RIFCSPLOWO2_12_FULL_45_22]